MVTKSLKPIKKIRRLFWDIETSPNVVLSWRIGYKINIDHDNILKERAIICIGYKWEGEKDAHCLRWDKNQDDTHMLASFMEIANTADELVAHNGDKFDLPWIRTRCIKHKIPTYPTYKTIDTLQLARRHFNFNSNRLDYLAKFLDIGAKIHTTYGLWKSIILEKDKDALDEMVKYCKYDVVLLEKVYNRIAEHVTHKTHAGAVAGRDKWSCAKCASEEVHCNLTRLTAAGNKVHQMKCTKCGGLYSITATVFKDYQEAMFDKKSKPLIK